MSESSSGHAPPEESPSYEDYEAVFVDEDGNPRVKTEELSKGGGDWDESEDE